MYGSYEWLHVRLNTQYTSVDGKSLFAINLWVFFRWSRFCSAGPRANVSCGPLSCRGSACSQDVPAQQVLRTPSSPGLAACSPRTGVSSSFLQASLKSHLHGDIQQVAIVSWLMVATCWWLATGAGLEEPTTTAVRTQELLRCAVSRPLIRLMCCDCAQTGKPSPVEDPDTSAVQEPFCTQAYPTLLAQRLRWPQSRWRKSFSWIGPSSLLLQSPRSPSGESGWWLFPTQTTSNQISWAGPGEGFYVSCIWGAGCLPLWSNHRIHQAERRQGCPDALPVGEIPSGTL